MRRAFSGAAPKKRTAIVAVALFALVILTLLWTRISWAWSPVDDAGHVLSLRALIDENGILGGMSAYTQTMLSIDLSWGLFRPSYWLYPSLFYLLDPGPAHALRLVFAILAIGGPLTYFYRNGMRGPRFAFAAILLVASGSALYTGLFLVSLQELSGAAFIGLGLALNNRWARWLSWLIAAWFKAPFAWILIGQALIDWRRGRRTLAFVNGGSGVITLAIAVVMSRTGSYTASYSLDPYMIWYNAQNLLEPQVVLLPLLALWWLAVTQGKLTWTEGTVIFGVAWVGYTLQLLPWSVTAYYTGPISYFLGLFLVSLVGDQPRSISPTKTLFALSVPLILGTVLVANSIGTGFRINTAMFTFQSCLQDHPGKISILTGNLVYVTSSEEGPIRLVQNLQIAKPDWSGSITLGSIGSLGESPSHVDFILNAGPSNKELSGYVQVCGGETAQVYEKS